MDFEEKNDFSLYFWLIFVEAPSENVVAMATREGYIFPVLVSKHHKVSRKIFCRFGVMLQMPQGGHTPSSPNRVKRDAVSD